MFAKPVDIDIGGRPRKRLSVLLVETVRFLIALSSPLLKPNDRVHIDAKFGIDGSGSHQTRHQLAENDEPRNDNDQQNCEISHIGTFWCPLSVTLNEKIIWSNKLSNSALFSRPLCLLREKENRESVL